MSLFGRMLANLSQAWLLRFRRRHELGSSTPAATVGTASLFPTEGRLLLHVGCGRMSIDNIPLSGFRESSWREIRFDADDGVDPDIVGTMTAMSEIPDSCVDAIFSSHNIEHLYPHEIPIAITEFYRVLKPSGFLIVTCPDLQQLCQLVVDDKLDEPAYLSPAGPIAPIDVLYGYRPQLAIGNLYMAHHYGFTLKTLTAAVIGGGFAQARGLRNLSCFDLWVLATKSSQSDEDIAMLTEQYLPQQA